MYSHLLLTIYLLTHSSYSNRVHYARYRYKHIHTKYRPTNIIISHNIYAFLTS